MKLRADLHTHSTCSDGSHSPAEVVRRAADAGVELFALTDHDNMTGTSEAADEAKRLGIVSVRGMEVSAYLGATKVHILGYGCEENEAYRTFVRERVEGARVRAEDARRKANAVLSLDVTLEEVEAEHISKDAPLHTMHVVRAFARRLKREVNAVYRELFAPGCAAFSNLCRPLPLDAVRIIHAMGGIAVLAHPVQILVLPEDVSAHFHLYSAAEKSAAAERYAGERDALMEELVAAGLDGIECYHSTHTREETECFLRFAKERKLLVTGGSDFHADGHLRKVGFPTFYADESLLSALRLL